MGRACGTHGGEEKCSWGNPKERDHFEELRVVGKDIIKIEFKSVGCKFIKLIWPRTEKAAG